jgi:hypothetical protein
MVLASILCTGREHELVKRRCAALRREHFHVLSALTLKETGRKFLSGDFELVVFCHTIPEAEQEATAMVIRKVNPSTRIVALVEREEWRAYADETVLGKNTRALVAICNHLTRQRPERAGEPEAYLSFGEDVRRVGGPGTPRRTM